MKISETSDIILSTINASYIHTSIGLRYLYANLDELQTQTKILEFTSHLRPADIAEKILQHQPKIIGVGISWINSVAISLTILEFTALPNALKAALSLLGSFKPSNDCNFKASF